MAQHTQIRLRRTALNVKEAAAQAKVNADPLVFGEPLYDDYNDYFIMADNVGTSVANFPRVKLVDPSIADNDVYFSNADTSQLITTGGVAINPKTASANVSYDSTNVENQLNILVAKTRNIAENGGPYAGSATDGGPASKVTAIADTTSTDIKVLGVSLASGEAGKLRYNSAVSINCVTGILKGAAWNDFAEFRRCNDEEIKPGQVVIENGDGTLSRSEKRLQPGASIVSDTYGMVIGEETEKSIPVAVAGRVLAYTFDKDELKPGDAVCSGEYGTVSKMSRLEMIVRPECILGYVSELPDYPMWNDRAVDGRVWIKLK